MVRNPLASFLLLLVMAAPVQAGRQATATATVTGGLVSSVTVVDGGSGYQLPPTVSFGGGGGTGANAAAILDGENVTSIRLTSTGSGYTSVPSVVIAPPPVPPSFVEGGTLDIDAVPRLVVNGAPDSITLVEWADTVGNPVDWYPLTNIGPRFATTIIVDSSVPVGGHRIYRTVRSTGMAFIPAGSFLMGDTFAEGSADELPVHSVSVSAFYVDKYLVSKSLWDEVKAWADKNGYEFFSGDNVAENHPAYGLGWYAVTAWCNARSEMEGRVPAYYKNAELSEVYKRLPAPVGVATPRIYTKWNAGYRLPTEAEWEKAARGGANGHRFPWSDVDTIDRSRANYRHSAVPYDLSPPGNYDPAYLAGGPPYTSPVGVFSPNGYGLCDMAGNVREWCWDFYGPYTNLPQTDPQGAVPTFPAQFHVQRGGGAVDGANMCRTSARFSPSSSFATGFRTVLSPIP